MQIRFVFPCFWVALHIQEPNKPGPVLYDGFRAFVVVASHLRLLNAAADVPGNILIFEEKKSDVYPTNLEISDFLRNILCAVSTLGRGLLSRASLLSAVGFSDDVSCRRDLPSDESRRRRISMIMWGLAKLCVRCHISLCSSIKDWVDVLHWNLFRIEIWYALDKGQEFVVYSAAVEI